MTRETIKQLIEDIVYNHQSVGAGLEDLRITDRYEAAEYGFNEAIRVVIEVIINRS